MDIVIYYFSKYVELKKIYILIIEKNKIHCILHIQLIFLIFIIKLISKEGNVQEENKNKVGME